MSIISKHASIYNNIYNVQCVIKPVKHCVQYALKKASSSDYGFKIHGNSISVLSKYFLNFYVPGLHL